ncbi:hypothetical protein TEA_024602 [Camellia sinensis var. sinensis]|uniref:RING-type E3 ubiquitin transferase n=1 Tax=Camellia sinensis var. sinensis TaxID=542762 RepID=A0A4S4E537_CAMSN|nr:hypothetical protein TEA_024602 [Camellia sinensis var. sinensis]
MLGPMLSLSLVDNPTLSLFHPPQQSRWRCISFSSSPTVMTTVALLTTAVAFIGIGGGRGFDENALRHILGIILGSPHQDICDMQKKQDIANAAVGSTKAAEDELTCSVCLEQVNVGELVRSLPCLHQFQAIWAGSSCGWHNVVTMFLFCSSMPSALIRGCASRELVLSVNLKLGQDCTTMDKAVLMLPIWFNRLTETFVAAYKITYTAIYP